MVKAHSPINWENEPSFNTPINETNLNKMDSTIGVLDDRIIEQETSKLDKSTAYTMVKDISFNENNGVFTVTRLNGSTFTIDTKLEKISINFSYNAETQQIEIILIDGTKQYIDISSLISPIDFVDSDTIGWEVTEDGKIQAKVLDGSITEDMLQPNYLAEIKVETEKSAQSATNAKASEEAANTSKEAAAQSEAFAAMSANDAKAYANSASTSATNAKASEDAAKESEDSARTFAANAGSSSGLVQSLVGTAERFASNADTSATNAANSASAAATSEANAKTSETKAKSYAVGGTSSRENEEIDNAKYYYEQSKSISESFSGALVPMGTVTFENLPPLEDVVEGWMYNISNEFVTNDKFKEGAGYTIPLGANVFKTFDGFWDVLAGSPVTGVKGNAEASYRRGNVNITKANVGLGNVDNTSDANKPISTATQTALDKKLATNGDSKSNTVTFTSNDVADGSAAAWTSVAKLTSGITHATLFQRVSQMFKNVRYLYKMLGTTDISTIGNGTVTNAISTLNSNLEDVACVQLSNGQIDFSQYKYIDILFQDLSINSGYFTKRYYVLNDGSFYTDGYITYANNSIYIVEFSITFANQTISTSNGYYCNLAGNDIFSCYAPYIRAILGHK